MDNRRKEKESASSEAELPCAGCGALLTEEDFVARGK